MSATGTATSDNTQVAAPTVWAWMRARAARGVGLHVRVRGAGRVARALLPPGDPGLYVTGTVTASDGTRYRVDTRSLLEWSIWTHGGYELEVRQTMLRVLQDGDVALDCGANVGIHTCSMARTVGPGGLVIAIEPVGQLLNRLHENCELNGLQNVVAIEKAVSSRRGAATFYLARPDRANQGQGSLHGQEHGGLPRVEVGLTTVDEVVASHGLNRLRLVKIDVEGHEPDVLRGGSDSIRRFQPHIIFEFDPDAYRAAGIGWTDVCSEIKALGNYKLLRHMRGGGVTQLERHDPVEPCMILAISNAMAPRLPARLQTARDRRSHHRRAQIVLLRDVPEEQRVSMDRFADGLARGLAQHSDFAIRDFSVHEPNFGSLRPLQAMSSYFTRFLYYPLAAHRQVADIYHIIDQGYAHVAALIPRARTIVTCHDLILLAAQDRLAHLRGRPTSVIRFRWSTSYLPKVAHVVCVSEATRKDLIRLCQVSDDRITVIPNGVGKSFRPVPQTEADALKRGLIGDRQYAILHVSSGVNYKNIQGTLKVTAALRDAGYDVVLVRVGVALTKEEQAVSARLRLNGSVIECGRVTDERLVEIYNACDVLLFPSYYEGFGWPPLEAMASGTPVVASTCASIQELVGDAGFLADASDVGALAAAVRSVLDSPEVAAQLRGRGRERASLFTWDRTVSKYTEVYARVLECAE